jgi:hypothetical protein
VMVASFLNKVGPSSVVGRLSAWSKTVAQRSPVIDALTHLYIGVLNRRGSVWAARAFLTSVSVME